MPVLKVDLEKKKKRPPRLSQWGCIVLFIGMPVFLCGLCYASIWLYGRYGGDRAASQVVYTLPYSTLVAEARYYEGRYQNVLHLYNFADADVSRLDKDFELTPSPYYGVLYGSPIYVFSHPDETFFFYSLAWNMARPAGAAAYDIAPGCFFREIYQWLEDIPDTYIAHLPDVAREFADSRRVMLTQYCYLVN